MKRWIAIILLLFSHRFDFSQFYHYTFPSPSRDLLRSRIVLGSGNERHFSQRLSAFDRDFGGIIEDQLTDLYRNPSYFADVDEPMHRTPAASASQEEMACLHFYGEA